MRIWKSTGLALALITCAVTCSAMDIEQDTLSNGIPVIVLPDSSADVAAIEVIYQVGGFAEQRPVTGISHMLEHMMFQGTEKHPKSAFTEELKKIGGLVNAFTSPDYTGYHELVPAEHLPHIMALEADRVQNLTLLEEDYLREIEVVKEERRMRTDDVPTMVLYERLQAAAFPSGPYHDPLVGWMDDLNHMTIEQVRDWYRQWYCADNMAVVIAGKVQPKAVFELAERTFGKVSKCSRPVARQMGEVPQLGAISMKAQLNTKVPILAMGYRVPSIVSESDMSEPYALLVAMNILDGGQSARFEKYLIREDHVASSIWVHYEPDQRFENLAVIVATAMPDVSIDRLERAIAQQVSKLQTEVVSDEELALAKMRLKAEITYLQDNPLERLHWIASYPALGKEVGFAEERAEIIDDITAEQVQAVMNKYFKPMQLIKAVGLPMEGEPTDA